MQTRAFHRRFAKADRIIEAAAQRGDIPGAVLHVRAHGHVIHERAFGRRRLDTRVPVALGDLFPVASLTKPVVAAGVLQLCEGGAIGLDVPVANYLPEFGNSRVLLRYDSQTGGVVTRPARGPITVRHLLTHTAGIHDGFVTSDPVMGTLYERAGVVYDSKLLLETKIRRLGPLPLAHDPGAAWTYGLSSDAAGRLIEVVSGERLDRYLSRFIFEPLGMSNTYFFVPAEKRHRVAARHVRANGRVSVMPPDPDEGNGARYLSGGGGLHTPVADYGRFVQAFLDGGRPILSSPSVEAMTSNQVGELSAFGFKYGLSVGLATSDAPGRMPLPLGGFGWYGIYGTWFWTLPERRAVVLLFSNTLSSDMNLPLFSQVVRAVEEDLPEAWE